MYRNVQLSRVIQQLSIETVYDVIAVDTIRHVTVLGKMTDVDIAYNVVSYMSDHSHYQT